MQGLVALELTPVHIPELWLRSQTVGRMASFSPTAATADAALVARIAAGDERALGELYDRHGTMVYGLASAIVRDTADAEEVAADAFAQLWRSASEYEESRGSVASWLSTITRSRALDRIRARQRRADDGSRGYSGCEWICVATRPNELVAGRRHGTKRNLQTGDQFIG